jgi:hypothetical protein
MSIMARDDPQEESSPEDEFSGETLDLEIDGIFDLLKKQDAEREKEDKQYAIWRDELAIFFT